MSIDVHISKWKKVISPQVADRRTDYALRLRSQITLPTKFWLRPKNRMTCEKQEINPYNAEILEINYKKGPFTRICIKKA